MYFQIIVAFLCTFLALQQVAAVVNNGSASKTEDSKTSSKETADSAKSTPAKESDSVSATSEEKANRREAPLADTYGAPVPGPTDSYLPSGASSLNLPIPVYGVPDAPTNNIVYPAPPPDIPPPVSLPSSAYGLPIVTTNFAAPITASVSTAYIPPLSNSFGGGSIKFEGPSKFIGPSRGPKPSYGPPPPPRPQYGPPRKPQFPSKYPSKFPFKGGFGVHKHVKPLSTYGPPSGYFKDNYSSSKLNFNFNSHNNLLSNINTFAQNSVSGNSNLRGHATVTQYEVPNIGYGVPNIGLNVPNLGLETHSSNLNLLNTNSHGISGQYGAPDISVQIIPTDLGGHGGPSISTEYGSPGGDVLGSPKLQYGPPQPSPHPKPPHPGVPAPPTPPDIKYDGWQPIPGLVSRVPASSYGVPLTGHAEETGDVGFNKDLLPPPLDHDSPGYGSIALGNAYNNKPVSDSYGAPLNTVTGSGGIVSSSGEEVHGQHLSHSQAIDVDIGQDINAVKSIGIEIYPSGSGSIGGHGHNLNVQDTYGAPPQNSYSSGGPYAASHSYNNNPGNIGSSLGFGSFNTFNSHGSFNSHKSHGYKGIGAGRGLIPPSGLYGVPPSGSYGTPLYSNVPHGPSLNALKINPPRHPVVHREPVPPGIFDSIGKGHKHHSHVGSSHGFGSTYLPPPVLDVSKPGSVHGPAAPSSLYSLPNTHSPVSFQNYAHGSSSAGLLQQNLGLSVGGGHAALSSYNVPLNVVDGSYNLPQTHAHTSTGLGGEVVGLDLSHPALTIDLTHDSSLKSSFTTTPDCVLHKTQSVPSLSYGVPSVNSYTASLSSLTTNIGGAHHINSGPSVDISYEVTEPQSYGHDSYDLNVAHSQKVSSATKPNQIEDGKSEGKAYGKTVAKSFGPHSELLQSESIDLNNIKLQGALGSYTLQIQSADGGQGHVPHEQVLNDELLQSILSAIEQPQQNPQSVIKIQKSLEKGKFVTNDTIPSVVGKVADAEIDHSSPVQYVVEKSNEVHANVTEDAETIKQGDHETNFRLLQDNGIALYFSNKQRLKKKADEATPESKKSDEATVNNSH
ncbi:hypothetical protein NQ315_010060 [Exocentrus adspersus]|uniref:Uncharacterized protein n=1 Tax=Exocentrus adspersus TaxID=1586481 RepID=A0AAV8WBC9_9CUCU|nr:hypothetical protein NQ315_010060 [Exocentrus adspersus]